MSKKKSDITVQQVIDGEPYYPSAYEICCDCGLTHKVKYEALDEKGKKIKGAKIRATAWALKKMSREERARCKYKYKKI